MATTQRHPDSTRTRNARRSGKDRRARARYDRDRRRQALIAEVPQLALEPYQLYHAEKARARERGKPTLRTMDEYRELLPISEGEPR